MDYAEMKQYIAAQKFTFYIETYGCQMNSHDSEKIAGILTTLGSRPNPVKEDADLILFNTCCVRENAENKIFGNVGKMKQIKQKRPHLIVGVCGCMMQQAGVAERLGKMFPFVDLIFGTNNMQELPQMIWQILMEKGRSMCIRQEGVAE